LLFYKLHIFILHSNLFKRFRVYIHAKFNFKMVSYMDFNSGFISAL
jgi:hypothetical protein